MIKNDGQEPSTACQECGAVESVKQTVPWQPNICSVCGTDIVDSDP